MSTGPKISTISIIIPTLNEAKTLAATLAGLGRAGVEVIVADGGSLDDTLDIALANGARVVSSQTGRAYQMNAGSRLARGEILLFLHADTKLPADFDQQVRATLAQPGTSAGAFRLAVDQPGRRFGLIVAGANLRSGWLQLPYGDQALFLAAELFHKLGGYAELPFLEDVELVRRLRRQGNILLTAGAAVTSARRWQRLGVWQTTLRNQAILLAYFLGASPRRLQPWYRIGQKR